MRRYSAPVPTARLVVAAAAASLAVAFFPGGSSLGLTVVNAALLVAALVDFALAPRPGDLTVEREVPRGLSLAVTAPLTWRLSSAAPRPTRVTLGDELPPSFCPSRRRATVRLGPRGRGAARAEIRPIRRGRFELGNVALRAEGPLGLVARQRRVAVPDTVRVFPSFTSKDEAELRITRARMLEVGLRSAQGRGGGTEFESLREYNPDDEFRRIDWAATARAGRAIVRTYRAERNQTVVLLLDAGRLMAARVGGVARIEHAMDGIMTVTAVASRLGDRVGFVGFDREVRAVVPPSRSARQLAVVTEAMYDLEPALVESDYRSAFLDVLLRSRRRALLVLFTELGEEALADTLLPALPLVARDHVVALAAVQDPDVVARARATPLDARATYDRAAAVAALEERRRLAARLRGLGVRVVDAPPGRLAAELADLYLDVKATGRL